MSMNIMIGSMMPMTIRVARVEAVNGMIMPGGMLPDSHVQRVSTGTMVHAAVRVHVPGLNARAAISMTFPAPAGSNRQEWAEIAHEKALMMLGPA